MKKGRRKKEHRRDIGTRQARLRDRQRDHMERADKQQSKTTGDNKHVFANEADNETEK